MKASATSANQCKTVMALIDVKEIDRDRHSAVVTYTKTKDIAVEWHQRIDIPCMQNRMPHPAGPCLETGNRTARNELPVILHRLVDKLDTVALRIIEMDQRGNKTPVGEIGNTPLHGNTSLFKPGGVGFKIGLAVHLPPHEGKVVSGFTGYRKALFLIIHTEAECASPSVHQLQAKIFRGIISPIRQIVRIHAQITQSIDCHGFFPFPNKPNTGCQIESGSANMDSCPTSLSGQPATFPRQRRCVRKARMVSRGLSKKP